MSHSHWYVWCLCAQNGSPPWSRVAVASSIGLQPLWRLPSAKQNDIVATRSKIPPKCKARLIVKTLSERTQVKAIMSLYRLTNGIQAQETSLQVTLSSRSLSLAVSGAD